MNRRVVTILLSAFLVAIVCSYLVYRVVGGHLAAAGHKATRVVAADRDVPLGSVLQAADLTTVSIVGTLPQGAILKPADAIGRGVLSELYQGEPIVNDRLAAPGSGGGLAATIPQGMRACAVKVNDVVGVAGFVTPGMRVDVLVSGNPPGDVRSNQGARVNTILQNIQVLSAGTDIRKDAEGKPQKVQVVNLLVTPEQAELLSLASSETRIQLVLRNPLDTELAKTTPTVLSSLYGDSPDPVQPRPVALHRVPRPEPRVYVIEVFNGSKHSQEKFSSGEEK